jgi:hypothetical protein
VNEAQLVVNARFRAGGELSVTNARFERCLFDNCRAARGRAVGVELIECTAWACQLVDVQLEDCLVQDLRTAVAAGGRRAPLFLWGGSAHRVTLTGTLGAIIWNPPRAGAQPASLREIRRYYASLGDWALDVSNARFTSCPSLRWGPPGRLIRRDPETQPLIDRPAAVRALETVGGELGVWQAVLTQFAQSSWPDEIVLVPALGAPKHRRERQLQALERLRRTRAFAEDG